MFMQLAPKHDFGHLCGCLIDGTHLGEIAKASWDLTLFLRYPHRFVNGCYTGYYWNGAKGCKKAGLVSVVLPSVCLPRSHS